MGAVPLYHMGSFSRSGETLLLRTLNAHPAIEIVHQLLEPDDERDVELFKHLRQQEATSLDPDHPLAAHRDFQRTRALILKNAVWEHAYPFRGFILVRNPFSVMVSARLLTEDEHSARVHRGQVKRWGEGIDAQMVPHLLRVDNLTAFCLLYDRKMALLHSTGLPIVHYERFVQDPEGVLRGLLPCLGLDWDSSLLRAHEMYPEGQLGHGKIKLWLPINQKSLDKYQKLADEVFDRIYALTATSLKLYGYDVRGKEVSIREGFDCRVG